MRSAPPRYSKLPRTQAYVRLKEQVQATFDFVVVTCYAVPALKRQISLLEKGVISSLPTPDHYPTTAHSIDQLKDDVKGYKPQLASSALLSVFSYFEAFVVGAIKEMLDFHGGPDAIQRRAEQRDTVFIRNFDVNLIKMGQRLRGVFDRRKLGSYRKARTALIEAGYRFPSELLSSYGIRMLSQKLGNLRAADIPDLLVHGLHMELDRQTIEQFHNIRDVRNKIAHGESVTLTLSQLSSHNELLRDLASQIDAHLAMYFMIHEVDE